MIKRKRLPDEAQRAPSAVLSEEEKNLVLGRAVDAEAAQFALNRTLTILAELHGLRMPVRFEAETRRLVETEAPAQPEAQAKEGEVEDAEV